MANQTNEKLGNIKIDRLGVGKTYKVHYSCFKKVNGSRGDFMSASFIIENEKGVVSEDIYEFELDEKFTTEMETLRKELRTAKIMLAIMGGVLGLAVVAIILLTIL